jgi:prepilin-type N-terminal cleavage/methylation domain-containing protein
VRPLDRSDCGFTLLELLVAIFVLAMAVSGAVAAIYAAGRSADQAREHTVAADLAGDALADALAAAELYRESSGGALSFDYNATSAEWLRLGPAGYQETGYRRKGAVTDYSYGWLWRAHSFEAATGLYSLDVWVFRNPDVQSDPARIVDWGRAPDSDAKKRQTLFYGRTHLEARKP